MVQRKIILIVFAVALAGLSSCGPEVELELYYYKQESSSGLNRLVGEFTRQNPEIGIRTTIVPNDADKTLLTRASLGKLPDIIQLPGYARVREYARSGYLLDLSLEPVLSLIHGSAKPAVTLDGRQYALPMDYAGIGIIYNKDIFSRVGISPPGTFPELKAAVAKLKARGIIPFAGLLKEPWSVGHFISLVHASLLGSRGGIEAINGFVEEMDKGRGSFGKAVDIREVTGFLDWYRDHMDPQAQEMNWNEQVASFAGGRSAMMVQGLWSYGAAKTTNRNLNCGFIPFPVTDNQADTRFFADVDSTFGISSQSSKVKQAAAKKFLQWLGTPQAIEVWTGEVKLTSAFRSADLGKMDEPFQNLMEGIGTMGAYPWAFQLFPPSTWEEVLKPKTLEYMLGKITPEDLVKAVDLSWHSVAP